MAKNNSKIRIVVILLIIVFSYHNAYSQHLVEGKIIDANTREPLAFANIIFNGNPYFGTTSDIDGKFNFNSAIEIQSVTCSYVGYKDRKINIGSVKPNYKLVIELQPSEHNLQEIIVIAGENPANRILRKTIKNKAINNPENISSFKYTSYNKVIYDLKPNETVDPDSIQIRMDKKLKGGYFLIMESVSERKFIEPDKNEETILSVKVSGLKNPSFAPLATDIQPFSFYKDIITIFDINYLNPISNGSLRKYLFNIEDTLFQNTDSIFIISFKPKPNKNFEALTGLLYINTNKYAIQYVIAEPFKKGFIDIKIQQKYELIDNKQWFPSQLNFELILKQYPSKKIGMRANGKSYISNIELFSPLDKKDFSLEQIKMHEFASKRDSLFWKKYRIDTLNNRELITYHVIDSIGKKHKLDAKLKFIEKVASNKIPIKFIDIDLSKTFVENKHEGFRLGFGAFSNEKISNYFSVGGFFGYGLKDKKWKYSGELRILIDKNNELELRCQHQNTLAEAGQKKLLNY